MSEDDDLAITDHLHHPHFPHPTFSASTSSRDSVTPTSQPKFKKHGVVSPVPNRGVGDLLHSLNASFAPPSSSRTSSPDEPAFPPVGSPARVPALEYHRTLTPSAAPPAIASTSSNDLRESQSPTPTRRYPRQSIVSPRKSNAADSIGRIYLRRRVPIPGDFYRPDLDELEAWTGAVVSPGVYGKPVFEKFPDEDTARAATRVNLAPLRRNIDGRSKSDVGGWTPLVSSSGATGRPSAVAKAEMTRAARATLILNDIFTPDNSIDGEISSNFPSRSSPGIDTPPSNLATVNGKHIQPPPFISTSRARPFSSTYDTRPKNRRPLQDLPVPPPQKIPPLHFNGTQIAKALAKKAREAKADRMEDMHFTLDPGSALHAQPTLSGRGEEEEEEVVESSEPEVDDAGIWQFLEPPAQADYYASTSFLAAPNPDHEPSHPLLHSPLPTPLRIPSPNPFPEHAIPEIDPPAPAPLPTISPEPEVTNSPPAIVIDTPPLDGSRNSPKPSVEAPPEEPIEIFSPMVLEERNALASHPPHPFQLLFDPILSSSLASASGEHFVATPAPAPPVPQTQESHDAQEVREGQGVQIREINMITEERIAHIYAEAVALPNENEYFNFDPPMDVQSEHGSSSAPGPRMGVESSAPPLSEAEGPAPSTSDIKSSSSLEPTKVEAPVSSDVPMAQATWVDVDAIPSEDTSSASSNFISQRSGRPIILDPSYLKPRYRDFWAPDAENPYLQRANSEMVVGRVTEGLVIWYQGKEEVEGEKEEQGEEGEEAEYDELENDVESEEEEEEEEGMEVEMEDPDSGVVFLSQTPTKARRGRKPGPKSRGRKPGRPRKNGSRAAPPPPDDPTMESVSVGARGRPGRGRPRGRGRGRGRGRYTPYDSSQRGQRKKVSESGDGDDNDLADRVKRWEGMLASFIKGKKTLEHQDLLDLKQALEDIRSFAASIPSDSSLVAQVSAVADMESDDVPMGDQLGLRALAKKLVRTLA